MTLSDAKPQNMAKWVCFGPLFSNLIGLIWLYDKENLTFVDYWGKNFIKLVMKNVNKLTKRSLQNIFQDSFNPLADMPILRSSNSVGNKNMMSKIWINGDTIIWLSRKHCEKRRNCSLRAISPFPTMFSKTVCCWCIKISVYGVNG